MPRQLEVSLSSLSPYSASKYIESPKQGKEKPDVYEEQCWRERLGVERNGDGKEYGIIPGMAFKYSLIAAQRYDTIKLKGNETYGKIVTSGMIPSTHLSLKPITRENVPVERCFVPSDGKPGGGKRVMKFFPVIPDWSGSVSFLVLDDRLTDDVLTMLFRNAGSFIGVGRWRIEKGGMYGRFKLDGMKSSPLE